MPVVDLHAHLTPERYKQAIRDRGEWYGLDETAGEITRGGFAISNMTGTSTVA